MMQMPTADGQASDCQQRQNGRKELVELMAGYTPGVMNLIVIRGILMMRPL